MMLDRDSPNGRRQVYTIGFSKRTAGEFFGGLRRAGVKRCLDVRVSNTSQLAGFTKQSDLPFFLEELCGAEYVHEPLLSPTLDLMHDFRDHRITWAEYERLFLQLMADRDIEHRLDPHVFDVPTVLLCVETTPEHCHRRLIVEYLQERWGNLTVKHL